MKKYTPLFIKEVLITAIMAGVAVYFDRWWIVLFSLFVWTIPDKKNK